MLPAIIASLLIGAGEPSNPLLDELLQKGLPLPGRVDLKLPPPMMTDGLTTTQQQAVLAKAAGTNPLELFLKKTDAAPFNLTVRSIEAGGKRVGQAIDLYFVAYGSMKRVIKEDVLNQLIGAEAKGKNIDKVKVLDANDLQARGIKARSGQNIEERFAGLDIFLLDKVKVTGVTDNVKTFGSDWAVLAMRLDPRFDNDKQYPNRWQSYDALNQAFGSPLAYSGLGGFARVTALEKPAGALFFEMHVGLNEPEAWFGGPNLLRSKLPLVVQENVRALRRKLSKD